MKKLVGYILKKNEMKLESDKNTSYIDIADYVEILITEKSNKQTTTETLPWVHIATSNAKRNFLGNYH